MNPQREKAVTDVINQGRSQGVKFSQTKQKLLSQGYTEDEIVYALYSDPYDGTGAPKQPNPLQHYYEEHPEQARRIAVDLLQQEALDDLQETTADFLGGTAGPDVQSRSYYDLLAADRLGIPYFTLTLGGPVILLILAIKLNWSNSVAHLVFTGFSLFVWLIFASKLIHERIRIRKMRP